MARRLYPGLSGYDLPVLAAEFGLGPAAGDVLSARWRAETAARLLLHLAVHPSIDTVSDLCHSRSVAGALYRPVRPVRVGES